MLIRCCFLVCMAVQATEDRIVRRIRVADIARTPLARVSAGVDGETSVGKRSACPCGRGVTGRTGGRESRGNMIGIRHTHVFGAVAGVTGRGRPCINPSNVTTGTLGRGMCAS